MISLVETLKQYNYQSANYIIQGGLENQNSLWLGDFTAAIDQEWQKAEGITAILTVAQGLNINPQPLIQNKVLNVEDNDAYDISKDLDEACEFISSSLKNGSVLVHCAAGVSRSASIVICYLMRSQNWNYLKAYNHVKNCRPIIFPNQGFVRCLLKEQKRLENNLKRDSPSLKSMRVSYVKILSKPAEQNNKLKQIGQFVYLKTKNIVPSTLKRDRFNNSEYFINRPNYNIINLYRKKGSLKPLLGEVSNYQSGNNSSLYSKKNELRESFMVQKIKRQPRIQ